MLWALTRFRKITVRTVLHRIRVAMTKLAFHGIIALLAAFVWLL